MGDELEKFVIENRDSFDSRNPGDQVWTHIDKKLNKRTLFWPQVWRVAAMIFMISTAYLLVDQNGNQEQGATLPLEFQQAEAYYISQISDRKELIKNELKDIDGRDFLKEIDMLDSMYVELKKTYQTNASSERISDALINNLQLRAEILDRQLEVLKIIKEQKNENELSIQI